MTVRGWSSSCARRGCEGAEEIFLMMVDERGGVYLARRELE